MARRPPSPLLPMGGLELLLTPLEAALVGIPLLKILPPDGHLGALLPWAGGLLLLWSVLCLFWLRPLLGDMSGVSEQVLYARSRALPTRALLTRLAGGGILGLVLVERLSRGGILGLELVLALLAICLLHLLCIGLLRWSLWHRFLRRTLDRANRLPPALTFQADTLRGRLSEVAMVLGVAAGLLLALIADLFIPLTSSQVRALEAYFSWPCLLLGAAWFILLMPKLTAPLLEYLHRASRGEEPPAQQLMATVNRAHRLPFLLALTKIGCFGISGLVLVLEAGPLLGIPTGQALLLLAALLIVALGAGLYEMIWSRIELRPALSHLLSRPDAEEGGMKATPIRVKMLLNLGGAVIFTVAIALFWTLLPQQNPVGLGALVVLVLAASLGVVHLTAADVTRPLAALELRAAEVVRGYLDREVHHDGEFDTSARISSSFEKMRRDLLRKLRTIEELNEELEEKVRRRTKALEKSNSELVEAIDALKETQTQLLRSEKMASVGQLVAGIAHEINNPINAVINSVGPLAETVQDLADPGSLSAGDMEDSRQDALEMLRVIRSGVERTQGIVRALKNYARTDGETPSAMDLQADIKESLALLAHLLHDVTVELQHESSRELIALRGQLNQALMNLLSNAAQALEGREDARLVVRTRDQEKGVEIEVEDNGPGIPEAALSRIFDPFFTTKEVGQGTGLGLSITHGIVERHRGEISVQSEPGKTLFTVTIPWRVDENVS